MSAPLTPGLLILHGNRLELLGDAVFKWLADHPLGPLESESFLVQSNGMAEWLKMELAAAHGICAATRVELPARFIWRAYRAVLGRSAVPAVSALDKQPLTWRFMQCLPEASRLPGFEPVASFLHGAGPGAGTGSTAGPEHDDGDAGRRLQLARRLADLFDQYQVYRSDWLADWAEGRDVLAGARPGADPSTPVPPDQRWQPALWRLVQETLSPEQREAARGALHQRFLRALREATGGSDGVDTRAFPALPRRLVLFGSTHIPQQTLEAIAALKPHVQVILAVPNPCQFHWADLIEGRELLRAERRRHPARGGLDLSAVPMDAMHVHGHPLLAAWGRQARDFIRLLDSHDDVNAARQRFRRPDGGVLRVDLFEETPAVTLLQQVQAAVRDLQPLAEHPWARGERAPPGDRSIVFHTAHSAQREVEILHDQLLHLLAQPFEPPAGGDAEARPLNPRDFVVMVPDIELFAPAIRSVFGQHARGHARHIPWGIADQAPRGRQPLLVALEWLLRLPLQRAGASEVRSLLEVPPLAHRFGLAAEDLPALVAWIEGAGVRWGLDAAHRESLGLGAAGDQNSWLFGLQRMLLGYATGELDSATDPGEIEPYAEVAGLAAGIAGPLADLLAALQAWWSDARQAHPPAAWAERLRRLLADLFKAVDDDDRALLAALDDALAAWLLACESAGFDSAVDLAVAREAWLDGLDEPGVSRRFKAGGVTFCTLLPLRAIPFEVVCLLGMNDGDYPRRSPRSDFDLMGQPDQARPGDRSRRQDDRQLMLDALLSARRVLYVSWAGRSQRDNQAQPPSVLVAQLRDYLDAGWGPRTAAERTTAHPLQPFSRVYFEPPAPGRDPALLTYAAEWRAAHADPTAPVGGVRAVVAGPPGPAAPQRITLAELAAFLSNPVKAYFRQRLQVVFDAQEVAAEDDEPFSTGGLDLWGQMNDVLRACRRRVALDPSAASSGSPPPVPVALPDLVGQEIQRLQRAGRLPIGGPGTQALVALDEALQPMLACWQLAVDGHPAARERIHVLLEDPADAGAAPAAPAGAPVAEDMPAAALLDDWIGGLRGAAGDPGAMPEAAPVPALWIELQASRLARLRVRKAPDWRADKLVLAWLRSLASAAMGRPAAGRIIGPGVVVDIRPFADHDTEAARRQLRALVRAWREGLGGPAPWPTAVATGVAWLAATAEAAAMAAAAATSATPDTVKADQKARQVYEGAFESPVPGEGHEPCLARLYPDYAALRQDPQFESVTRTLYEPLRAWLDSHVTASKLDGAPDDDDGADDE